ncbi:MAG: helix-turn-helix domain-containing protein [Roseburia sp.]|nr:helix-turn-helix domain-containing protein [Roseburia sp.]
MNKVFCERLKELRQDKKIGQEELAARLGVSKGIISFWENGLREPTMGNLKAIAQFFEVSTDYLVGLKDD